jgi:hypothetical protein
MKLISEYCVLSYFYIKSLMHFNDNRTMMKVHKYIWMQNLIFHLFATYFISCVTFAYIPMNFTYNYLNMWLNTIVTKSHSMFILNNFLNNVFQFNILKFAKWLLSIYVTRNMSGIIYMLGPFNIESLQYLNLCLKWHIKHYYMVSIAFHCKIMS